MQGPRARLADLLSRLDNHLDTGTLEATVSLMLDECRSEVRRLRGRIAMAPRDGEEMAVRLSRLDEHVAMEGDLAAALQRVRERGDLLGADDEAPAVGATVVSLRNARH